MENDKRYRIAELETINVSLRRAIGAESPEIRARIFERLPKDMVIPEYATGEEI